MSNITDGKGGSLPELSQEQRSLQNSTRLLNQRFLIRGSLLHYYFGTGCCKSLLKGLLRGHKIYKIRCLDAAEFSSRYLIRRSVRGNRLFLYDASGCQLLKVEFRPKKLNGTHTIEYTVYNRGFLSCFERDTVLAVIKSRDSKMEIRGLANWSEIHVSQEENWLLLTNEHGTTTARMQQLQNPHRVSSEMELYGCTQQESVMLLLVAFLWIV